MKIEQLIAIANDRPMDVPTGNSKDHGIGTREPCSSCSCRSQKYFSEMSPLWIGGELGGMDYEKTRVDRKKICASYC